MGERKFVHMTNMAAIPIYDENLQKTKFFSGAKWLMTLKVGMQHWVLKYYQVFSNDDPGLTLTYFIARSNLVPFLVHLYGKKVKQWIFSETVVYYDIKVGRCG